MKFLTMALMLFSTTIFAASTRTLDGQAITNGAALITLPTSSVNMSGLTALSGSNTGDVTIGTANGLSLSGQALSLQAATASVPGALLAADFTTFAAKLSSALTNGHIFVGSAGGVATDVAVTGDVTISNAGVTAIGVKKVLATMLGSGAASSGAVATADGSGGVTYTAPVSVAPSISGSIGTPTAITAVGGVVFSGTSYSNTYFISGSGGAVTVTANPQISAATNVGQKLDLIGGTNTVTLADGNGLSLNGSWVGGVNSALVLEWDGTVWHELTRR